MVENCNPNKRLYDRKTAAYGADFAIMVLEILRYHLKPPQEITLFSIDSPYYPNNYSELTREALKRDYNVIGPEGLDPTKANGSIEKLFVPFANSCFNRPCMIVDIHYSHMARRYLQALRAVGASHQFYAYPNPLEGGHKGGILELFGDNLYELSPIGKNSV